MSSISKKVVWGAVILMCAVATTAQATPTLPPQPPPVPPVIVPTVLIPGPQGPMGPMGPQGPAGPAGTTIYIPPPARKQCMSAHADFGAPARLMLNTLVSTYDTGCLDRIYYVPSTGAILLAIMRPDGVLEVRMRSVPGPRAHGAWDVFALGDADGSVLSAQEAWGPETTQVIECEIITDWAAMPVVMYHIIGMRAR
jgi:hypothetical protein